MVAAPGGVVGLWVIYGTSLDPPGGGDPGGVHGPS